MSKGLCSAPECVDEAARDGLCWHHHRQRATGQVMKPKSEAMAHKLTPWALLVEAVTRFANAKDIDETDYEGAADLLRKTASSYGRKAQRERIREGMSRAKAKGKHVGRPRKASKADHEIAQVVDAMRSERRAAKAMGLSRGYVRRALERVRNGPKGNLSDQQ